MRIAGVGEDEEDFLLVNFRSPLTFAHVVYGSSRNCFTEDWRCLFKLHSLRDKMTSPPLEKVPMFSERPCIWRKTTHSGDI